MVKEMKNTDFEEALLRYVRKFRTKTEAAESLSISRTTLDRWLGGEVENVNRSLMVWEEIRQQPDSAEDKETFSIQDRINLEKMIDQLSPKDLHIVYGVVVELIKNK